MSLHIFQSAVARDCGRAAYCGVIFMRKQASFYRLAWQLRQAPTADAAPSENHTAAPASIPAPPSPDRPDVSRLEPFYRAVVKYFILLLYRPVVRGLEHIPEEGPVLLMANHISYLDGLVISAICPRRVRYVIYREIYDLPVINYFMRQNRAIPIFPKREEVEKALDEVAYGLRQGDVICIFPEGQISYTGHIGRFKPGIEFIIQRDPHIPVVPIAIHGLWGSIFSRKYLKTRFPYLPRKLGIRARIEIGWPIESEKVKVDKLQRIVLRMLQRASGERP
jgi:1-acyl-sn-glycerol-3-phosphate acyltransferase